MVFLAICQAFYTLFLYLQVHSLIVNEDDASLTLQINIEEGPKYFYRDFIFDGNQIAEQEELKRLLGIQSGDMYSKEQFDKSVYENMMSIYQDKGYIFSSVSPEITPSGKDSLDVKFVFNEGNKVFVENIFVSGNEKTRENVIRRELKLYPGDVFSRSKLMRSQRDISVSYTHLTLPTSDLV